MQDRTRTNVTLSRDPLMTPLILDSVTHLQIEHRGRAAYCASHGGTYAGFYAAKMGVGAVILNDAGIGRDRAGLSGVVLLDGLGVPAATIAHTSARIGDGSDGHVRGVLSFVNAAAAKRGLTLGMRCSAALDQLSAAHLTASPTPQPIAEQRFEHPTLSRDGVRVIIMDSNGDVRAEDSGHIVVTGSHGGLLGGKPETAVKHPVFAAVYNDAGIGIDNAGISRLAALDAQGIAAACVAHTSARIGDGRSTLDDGIISALNHTARRHGGAISQTTQAFVAAMVAARIKDRTA
jgi:hypothetical protein